MTATIRWSGTVTAVSSIAHGGQQLGTTTLMRREKMLLADGRIDYVPVISGNTLRGWLRRVGEDLLRQELQYDGQLSLTAAHALRGGGALAKTSGKALAGQRLATLRSLVPQIGVFGCAAGGSVVNGCLQVGKVVPLVTEVTRIVPTNLRTRCTHSHFDLLQVETFARQDDTGTHAFAGRHQVLDDTAAAVLVDDGGRQMFYGVETFPAGTEFHTWAQLTWASSLEVAFFTDVLHAFSSHGRLGGRIGSGHGVIRAHLTPELLAGDDTEPVDWRAHLRDNHDDAMEALTWLT
jgi:hypothetical protein